MGSSLIIHCITEAGKELILEQQLKIVLGELTIPIPSCQFVPKYKINHHKYKVRITAGGLLTTDLAIDWLKTNQGWDIKEIIIENRIGTTAETGKMTLFVNFPTVECVQNLPDSYNVYGYTIKISHQKILTPCSECS